MYVWAKNPDTGLEWAKVYPVGPQQRYTFSLLSHTDGNTGFYSTVIYSQTQGVEVYPTRSSYWAGWAEPDWEQDGLNWDGSAAESGGGLSTDWYFPEAGTLNQIPHRRFQSFLKVFNPNSTSITVTATLYNNANNQSCSLNRNISPYGTVQYWLAVDNCGWPYQSGGGDITARVYTTSGQQFTVDFIMYQENLNPAQDQTWRVSGQSLRGVPVERLSSTWYFPEATNDYNWQPRYYVMNPGPGMWLKLEFWNQSGGGYYTRNVWAPSNIRVALDGQYDSLPPTPGKYHLKISPDSGTQAFAVQKVQYWDKNFEWIEGIGTTGEPAPGTKWIVPFGTSVGVPPATLGDRKFHSYLFVSNPNATTRYFRVTWFKPSGPPLVSGVFSIAANGWIRIHVDDYVQGQDHGALVQVTDAQGNPVSPGSPGVVVEAATYFNKLLSAGSNPENGAWRAGESATCFKIE